MVLIGVCEWYNTRIVLKTELFPVVRHLKTKKLFKI